MCTSEFDYGDVVAKASLARQNMGRTCWQIPTAKNRGFSSVKLIFYKITLDNDRPRCIMWSVWSGG